MNKRKWSVIGLVLFAAMAALFLLGHTLSPTTKKSVATSTQTTAPSTPRQAPIWGEYHVNAPNALILVDSQGRRTGKDPISGTLYREIPSTSYGEEAGTPGHWAGEVFTSNIPNGQYTLYVLSGKTGIYSLAGC
jgi:hypothetical protein